MKNKVPFTILTVILILLIPYFVLVGHNFQYDAPKQTPLTDHFIANKEAKAVGKILERKCMDCHSSKGRVPFYGKWPIARDILSHHIQEGLEEFNAEEEFFKLGGQNLSTRTLNHLEHVFEDNEMPILPYTLLHWKAAISEQEKNQVLNWVQSQQG